MGGQSREGTLAFTLRGKGSTRDGTCSPALELFALCLLASLPMSFCLPVRLWGHHSLPLLSWVTSQDQTIKQVFFFPLMLSSMNLEVGTPSLLQSSELS